MSGELLVGEADQDRLAEGVGELDAAKGGAEVPSAMLQVEADPVEAGTRRGLDDQRLGDRQPSCQARRGCAAARRSVWPVHGAPSSTKPSVASAETSSGPAATAISRTPSAGDSISTSDFSVSMVAMVSPLP